jgi:hypothetical protein
VILANVAREIMKTPGTLQPLPIPRPTVWTNISMDFIIEFTEIGNKSVIMVVVDTISKYAHFHALQYQFKASIVAQFFMENIFKLHGNF